MALGQVITDIISQQYKRPFVTIPGIAKDQKEQGPDVTPNDLRWFFLSGYYQEDLWLSGRAPATHAFFS